MRTSDSAPLPGHPPVLAFDGPDAGAARERSPRLKVILYGINFAPELTGIGKYTGEMAAWLAARGHDVRVISAPPYYPEWAVWPGYRAGRYTRERWQGVDVIRAPLWVPRKVTGLRRMVHMAGFALSSLPALWSQWRWRPDVVWVVAPAFACVPGALALARLRGAQAWLHIQDFEIDAAFDLGMLKSTWMRRGLIAAERWLMCRFDRVSTISQRMLERAHDKGVQDARLVHLPNWVDISAIRPLQGVSSFRPHLGIPSGAVVALYSGNMGAKQGLDVLAEVAVMLQRRSDIHWVFCGAGVGREALVQRCAGLSNVHFLDLQPADRLQELLGMADIHLLPQRADAADLVMPSKLTGMLSSGRPVVAGARPETELGQVVSHCGQLAVPEDAGSFARAIEALADQPAWREELGQKARAWAEQHLARESVLLQFEADLHACLANTRRC